jgi:hypothetical protein
MRKWSVAKDLALGVQGFRSTCFGDDTTFQEKFHEFRGDTSLNITQWQQISASGAGSSRCERHWRELKSNCQLRAPMVVQRMLGDVETATVRVVQTRICEGSAIDGSLYMKVEQNVELEGLPLEDAYVVKTVMTVRNASTRQSQDLLPAAPACNIEVEGQIECKAGATGLKGVIEGVLYSQSQEATVLFLELLESADCSANCRQGVAPPSAMERSGMFRPRSPHAAFGDFRPDFRPEPLLISDSDSDDSVSIGSWDSARSWLSNDPKRPKLTERHLREQLEIVATLKKEGLLEHEAVLIQQRSLLKKFRGTGERAPREHHARRSRTPQSGSPEVDAAASSTVAAPPCSAAATTVATVDSEEAISDKAQKSLPEVQQASVNGVTADSIASSSEGAAQTQQRRQQQQQEQALLQVTFVAWVCAYGL